MDDLTVPSPPRKRLRSPSGVESTPSRSGAPLIKRAAGKTVPQISLVRNLNPDHFEQFVLNVKGREWLALDEKERDALVELGFLYWRRRGFPHYRMSDDEIAREYDRLVQTDSRRLVKSNKIQIAMAGVKLANYFHPQMWSVRVKGAFSPAERFQNDASLRRLIRHALRIWPDRKAINDVNLRAMLRTFSNTTRVSNFRPTAAKVIYELFSKDGDTVVDFAAGYGGRLLGCLPLRRNYIGIDPCREQIQGINRMFVTVARIATVRSKVRLHCGCAEDVLPTLRNSASLVFSSPPYFDLEKYSAEGTQSYLRYPDYVQWREGFLGRVVAASSRVLIPKGFLAINVADVNGFPLAKDTQRLASPYFRLVKTLKLRLANKPYLRDRTSSPHKHEDIFVFRKK